MTLRRGPVDWNVIGTTIRLIHSRSSEFLQKNVLIGGAAAWFYKQSLTALSDPDFPSPSFTEEELALWYSKDMDFLGMTVPEMARLLGVEQKEPSEKIHINDTWIDSPVIGVVMNEKNCFTQPRRGVLGDVHFLIVNPVLLYEEKKTLCGTKNRPQDRLHVKVLKPYISAEFCLRLEREGMSAADAKKWKDDAIRMKSIEPDFFKDEVLSRRLLRAQGFQSGNPKAAPVLHWIKHHVKPSSSPMTVDDQDPDESQGMTM